MDVLCKVEGCARIAAHSEMCNAHYIRVREGKDLTKPIRVRAGRGELAICKFEGCNRTAHGWGYCSAHYKQSISATRRPMRALKFRARSGSGFVNQWGYKFVPTPDGPRFEHRVVMEQTLGRPLVEKENVHHKNGNRLDNRPENLELWSTSQPSGQRVADKRRWALELLNSYDAGSEEDSHYW